MKQLVYMGLFLPLFFSCNAPRENPLDPDAANYYNPGSDSIVTEIRYTAGTTNSRIIADVEALIPEIHFFALADANGRIRVTHLPQDSLTVYSIKTGFFKDTTTFAANTALQTQSVILNAKPETEQIVLRSVYENIESFEDIISIELQARISDADGLEDIRTVRMQQPEFAFDTTLTLTNSLDGTFGRKLFLTEISRELTWEQLPEKPFYIHVTNQDQRSITSGPFRVIRVITESPAFNAPVSGSSLRDSVRFEWTPFHLGYTFYYNVVLNRIEDGSTYTYANIPKEESVYVVRNLPAGNYYSFLQIEDTFGNICQSVATNFTFQP